MAKGSALTKEMHCSEELAAIVKSDKIARGQMMKLVWKYIDKHDLKSADDGRIIRCDEKLAPLFKKLIKEKRTIVMRGKTLKIPAGHIFMTELAGGLSKQLS